jgi:quercetin dioxygenase-like cupin family protein
MVKMKLIGSGVAAAVCFAGLVGVSAQQAPAKTLNTGEAFLIPAGTIHSARNTGGAVAKVVATYVVEKGKPMATPAP